jgi:hypothetical protein
MAICSIIPGPSHPKTKNFVQSLKPRNAWTLAKKRLNTMTGLGDEDVIPDFNNSERHLHAN